MENKDGGPAFPTRWKNIPQLIANGEPEEVFIPGMSMRDYFAAQALIGLLAGILGDRPQEDDHIKAATDAYAMADAMLAARRGKEKP